MRIHLAITILAIVLVSCAPATGYSPTETFSAKTPTPTITYTTTHIPTPTSTARPTETRTPVPTFTPATPSPGSESYRLQEWSADKADLLIAQISSYLSSIEDEQVYLLGVYGGKYYMEQFRYLVFIEEEALLRFPNVTQAESWRWDVCYNLAFSYPYAVSTDAPELPCYSKLIEDGLNTGQTDLSNLSNWFSAHEARFQIAITSFNPPQGYASGHIIMLEGNASWLLLERDERFEVTGLMSNMFYFRESGSKIELIDLTGDDYPELVLYNGISHCCGAWSAQFIYELSSGKPRQLMFENLSGVSSFVSGEYDSFITCLDANIESPGLLFKHHYYGDPNIQPCTLRQYEKYYWTNNGFELVGTWSGIDEPNKYNDIKFCQFVLDTAKEQGELDVAVKTIGDMRIGEPDVTEDQILYRLGEYHARLGNVEKAKEYFTSTVSYQYLSNESVSQWAQDAQTFLDGYNEGSSFYILCSHVPVCDMRSAFRQIIDDIELESYSITTELLQDLHILIKSSGYSDFDYDGDYEQWVVVQHPGRNQREFWILVKAPEKLYGLFVAEISTNKPEFKDFQSSDILELTTTDGKSLFSLEELSLVSQPYILTHDDGGYSPLNDEQVYILRDVQQDSLNNITDQIMNGADLASLQKTLGQLEKSKTYDCNESGICDQLYYLLGLTNELLGNDQAAVSAYLQLWETYPQSSYTIMARSKLEVVP